MLKRTYTITDMGIHATDDVFAHGRLGAKKTNAIIDEAPGLVERKRLRAKKRERNARKRDERK